MHTISGIGHSVLLSRPFDRSRRSFAVGAAALAGCATTGSLPADVPTGDVAADLETYAGFGPKNAGGAGDTEAGAWIEARLGRAGFVVERHALRTLAIEEREPVLVIGGARVPVATQAVGAHGAVESVRGPLRVWGAPLGAADAEANGAVVIAHLPSQRWSSAEQPVIRQVVEQAFVQNAAALVLVTHGPTRELIKLNRKHESTHAGPIALLAPRDWPTLQSARETDRPIASLELNAREVERPAFNVIARINRGAPSTIVVSTPRSGWTQCAGERGPGIAAFLAMSAWAPRAFPRHNLLFLCTSAHEFENAGNAAIIAELAPRPEATALWLHLGAGFAARDWHEAGGQIAPLPSPDPQRFLVTSPQMLDAARGAFAGLTGLEAPYSSERGTTGELSNIIAAGYPAVIGMLGAHRFHHVAQDDMRCVEPAHTHDVIVRTARLMQAVL